MTSSGDYYKVKSPFLNYYFMWNINLLVIYASFLRFPLVCRWWVLALIKPGLMQRPALRRLGSNARRW